MKLWENNADGWRLCGYGPACILAFLANWGVAMVWNDIGIVITLLERDHTTVTPYLSGIYDSAAFVGASVGMIALGYAADKFGRKVATQVALMIALVGGVVAIGDVKNLECSIIAGRVILGIGAGGVMSLTASLAYEEESTGGRRGEDRAGFVVAGQIPGTFLVYGCAVCIFWAVGQEHFMFQWRLLCALCTLPFAVCLAIATCGGLKETPAFLEVEKADPDGLAPCVTLFEPRTMGMLGLLGSVQLVWNFISFGTAIYSTEITEAVIGDAIIQVYYGELLQVVFVILGGGGSLYFLPRIGARRCFVCAMMLQSLCTAIFGVAYSQGCAAEISLVLFSAVRGAAQTSGIPLFALAPAAFPTRLRSTCSGLVFTAGKIGAIAGTLAFPNVIAYYGLSATFFVSACLALVCGACVHAGVHELATPTKPPPTKSEGEGEGEGEAMPLATNPAPRGNTLKQPLV